MRAENLRAWLALGRFTPRDLHQVFSDCIKTHDTGLLESFKAGSKASELIHRRSHFTDEILSIAWHHFIADQSTLALVAVGGYGRRELHPHSDIDILILRGPTNTQSPVEETQLADFLKFLWDIGLKPAQSVRTLDECFEQAEADQTVMTNLLDARCVLGSEVLLQQLWTILTPERLWSSAAFFEAKSQEQAARYAKYHDTAFNLEPNVKESPGGLRDIQTINWIIKRHYNNPSVDLIQKGWLTPEEHEELMAARDFLWEVRFGLHALTGRAEDRLLFEHQKDLARQFGDEDHNVNQAVEHFMQRYYRTVMGLERLNELLLLLFQEIALDHDQPTRIEPINSAFQSVNGYIEALHPKIFPEDPLALLDIFLLLQTQPQLKGIRASTIRLIRQNLSLIDENFRNNPRACETFMALLRQPRGVTRQLRKMNRYGVLAAYIPAFARVVGRMQYDLFHVYTVDEHTLFVIRNLRRFTTMESRSELPFASEVFERIEKPELLYVAALMHDIGKGSGGDHSKIGADIAGDFLDRHGVQGEDRRLVIWMVENHLLMSLTAQRKDISDPDVIHAFATMVGNQRALDHLYLLTVADIRATNPSLWNTWKDALLRELYQQTRWTFRRGLARPLDMAERIRSIKEESGALLGQLKLPAASTETIWTRVFNDEYFLRHHPEEIAWHTIALSSPSALDLPLIMLRPVSQRGSAELFVYSRQQDFIFAHTTAVLDQLNLTILDARIISSADDHVVHTYHVLDQSGEAIQDPIRQLQISGKLRESLAGHLPMPFKVQRRESRQVKHFTVPTQIYFHEDPQQRSTVMELIATDRPGLLSKVGRAFSLSGVRLDNARISTIGSRAEDIFYLTGHDHLPLKDAAQLEMLKDTILSLVGRS